MVTNKNNIITVIFDDTHYVQMSSFGLTLAFSSVYGYYAEKPLNTFRLKLSI